MPPNGISYEFYKYDSLRTWHPINLEESLGYIDFKINDFIKFYFLIETNCNDGIDNDGDNKVDCEDDECNIPCYCSKISIMDENFKCEGKDLCHIMDTNLPNCFGQYPPKDKCSSCDFNNDGIVDISDFTVCQGSNFIGCTEGNQYGDVECSDGKICEIQCESNDIQNPYSIGNCISITTTTIS